MSTQVDSDPLVIQDIVSDVIGNVIDDGPSTYTYDLRNKLVEHADDLGQPQITYRYDATGLRVLSTAESGGSTGWTVDTYLLPDGNPMLEITRDETSAVVEEKLSLHLGTSLLAIVSGSTTEHVISDHIGYPIATLNNQGTLLWHADHKPFGEIAAPPYVGSATDDPLRRYPGQWQLDSTIFLAPTSLYLNGYRWYNKRLGQYTQSDPHITKTARHTFAYVSSQPLTLIDSLGLSEKDPMNPGPDYHSGPWGDRPDESDCCVDEVTRAWDRNMDFLDAMMFGVPPSQIGTGVTAVEITAISPIPGRPSWFQPIPIKPSQPWNPSFINKPNDPCVAFCVAVHEWIHAIDSRPFNINWPQDVVEIFGELPAYRAGRSCLESFFLGQFGFSF